MLNRVFQGRMVDKVEVLLGLGTNMGDRLLHLRRALLALAAHPELDVTDASRVYETQFVGEGEQAPYLNACVVMETALPPRVLLTVLKSAELRQGRPPAGHMLPRPIDLDILFYGDLVLAAGDLVVPHKCMRDRAFVLEPLAEIAPEKKFPDSGETIAAACAKIRRKSGPWVRPLPAAPGWPTRFKEEWRAALAVHCR